MKYIMKKNYITPEFDFVFVGTMMTTPSSILEGTDGDDAESKKFWGCTIFDEDQENEVIPDKSWFE